MASIKDLLKLKQDALTLQCALECMAERELEHNKRLFEGSGVQVELDQFGRYERELSQKAGRLVEYLEKQIGAVDPNPDYPF